MGQYFLTVNLDKRQFLDPHAFGEGLKLREFGSDGYGLLMGLMTLLVSPAYEAVQDLASPAGLAELAGSWAGDRIVIAGDYDDPGRFGTASESTLYGLCRDGTYQDISGMVIELLLSTGFPVTWSPAVMRDQDPAREQRCQALTQALPEWARQDHPVLCPDMVIFGGR